MTAFLTTGIGSMPRRSWLFSNQAALDGKHDHYGKGGTWMLPEEHLSEAQDDATIIAIYLQEKAGLDIITDGEQRRKNYVTYLTSNMNGFDYEELKPKEMAGGRRTLLAGRFVGSIIHKKSLIVKDLEFTLSKTKKTVKSRFRDQ
tara:strand:- start:2919 stop:3353 length:435 start_codon:yes stop_codon:yes gene_type:complete